MTDKIKLKADKFVNDKKLKLNYIKPKDLKLLLAEFCEEQIAELKAECDLAIEGRDIRIAELEKENAELKKKCYKKAVKDYCELEKENAELKSNRDYWKGSSIYWHKQLKNKKYRKIAKATQQQLTKAKEIIKDLLNLPFASNEEVFADIGSHLYKAEQFLKDSKQEE